MPTATAANPRHSPSGPGLFSVNPCMLFGPAVGAEVYQEGRQSEKGKKDTKEKRFGEKEEKTLRLCNRTTTSEKEGD